MLCACLFLIFDLTAKRCAVVDSLADEEHSFENDDKTDFNSITKNDCSVFYYVHLENLLAIILQQENTSCEN
ncbi:hypothetical protein T4D_7273 [Trichinella pseudospiralis]|uniref:Secreted protein n=1 Tax=Trichinella pseudospiralis TaxID=6337 RepID=A0A0V1FC54_TRIPS|nr:hypothetical protein T4D_7273 [Trichinella pseudospiralis]